MQEHIERLEQMLGEALLALQAAQAEIERKHALCMDVCDQRDVLKTKLRDLRTAAEQHLENNPTGNGVLKFRAAIEASR